MSYIYRTIKGIKNYEHRHVMERHLGRRLQKNEHIYHLNADPKDNRIENLIIIKKKFKNDDYVCPDPIRSYKAILKIESKVDV